MSTKKGGPKLCSRCEEVFSKHFELDPTTGQVEGLCDECWEKTSTDEWIEYQQLKKKTAKHDKKED